MEIVDCLLSASFAEGGWNVQAGADHRTVAEGQPNRSTISEDPPVVLHASRPAARSDRAGSGLLQGFYGFTDYYIIVIQIYLTVRYLLSNKRYIVALLWSQRRMIYYYKLPGPSTAGSLSAIPFGYQVQLFHTLLRASHPVHTSYIWGIP